MVLRERVRQAFCTSSGVLTAVLLHLHDNVAGRKPLVGRRAVGLTPTPARR